ncbi:MAG: hypothetical protein JKY66_06385 [Spongiibacteraceae bacterium]|nr:hypothetical protein [Spongiibacteraceae bacterium]
MKKSNLLKLITTAGLLCLSMAVSATTPPPPVDCPSCTGYQKGPNPTESALLANSGPYSVSSTSVSSFVSGFGGGHIHYPTNAEANDTFGAIAAVPGYLSYESSIEWWGPRLASHGFIVITIDTNSTSDQPDSRARQLSAALNHLISESNSSSSEISGMVDSNRVAVIGWSMGGGGALKLSTDRQLNATIPQAPYYSGRNDFDEISSPTLIIACEDDSVAAVRSHASPFYNDIPRSTPKAFVEINGGSHYCANSGYADEDILGKYGIAWMKRWVDFDERYTQFLCGPNHEGDRDISEWRDSCSTAQF